MSKSSQDPGPEVTSNQEPVSESFLDTGSLSIQFGKNLRAYREEVLKESLEDFAVRLHSEVDAVALMEQGVSTVPFELWLRAFKIMQVDAAVLAASNPTIQLLQAMMLGAEEDDRGS